VIVVVLAHWQTIGTFITGSEYPATDKKTEITHDDLMIIYPEIMDTPSKTIYFDNEGHTINYIITYSGKFIVFMSERKRDIPVFRLTYVSFNNETISTRFEVSQDGEEFITYIEGISTKIK
jgi:hypothetical protein